MPCPPQTCDRDAHIFTDLKECKHRSYNNHKWACHFIDDTTRYRKTYYLKSKADAWLALRRFIEEECEPLGIVVQTLRHDGGTEYGKRGEVYIETSRFKEYLRCKPQGAVITVERSPAFCPEMNGVVERYNQTLWNVVRSILHDQDRDELMWSWACRFANKIFNTQKTVAVSNKHAIHGMA